MAKQRFKIGFYDSKSGIVWYICVFRMVRTHLQVFCMISASINEICDNKLPQQNVYFLLKIILPSDMLHLKIPFKLEIFSLNFS